MSPVARENMRVNDRPMFVFVFLMPLNVHIYVRAPTSSCWKRCNFFPGHSLSMIVVAVVILPNISGECSTSLFIKQHIRGWHFGPHTINNKNVSVGLWNMNFNKQPLDYLKYWKLQMELGNVHSHPIHHRNIFNFNSFFTCIEWFGARHNERMKKREIIIIIARKNWHGALVCIWCVYDNDNDCIFSGICII